MTDEIKFDEEGFLIDVNRWNTAIAEQIAEQINLTLTADHWQILHLTRTFYQQFQLSPAMRPLVKFIKLNIGEQQARSIYLMQLFGETPAKTICKLAGLPKPENCL